MEAEYWLMISALLLCMSLKYINTIVEKKNVELQGLLNQLEDSLNRCRQDAAMCRFMADLKDSETYDLACFSSGECKYVEDWASSFPVDEGEATVIRTYPYLMDDD